MAGREWPLVLFTLLSQFAVGTYLLAVLPLLLVRRATLSGESHALRLILVLIVTGLLASASLASFFHLGNLRNAFKALNNLKQSWLSREILFELATLILLTALALLIWLKVRNPTLARGTALLAGAAGLLFLLSMARLYMLPTVKAWNTFFTPISFFLTAFLLGAGAAVVAGSGWLKLSPAYGQSLHYLILFLAAANFLAAILAAPHFGLWGHRPAAGLKLPADPSRVLFFGRMIFLLAGAILLAIQVKKFSGPPAPSSRLSALVAFFCFLAAEILGRFLFYGFYLRRRQENPSEAR